MASFRNLWLFTACIGFCFHSSCAFTALRLDIAERAEGDSGAEANRSRAEREAKVARNAGDARSSLWNFVFREVTKRELAKADRLKSSVVSAMPRERAARYST